MIIRDFDFSESDYQAVADIWNATYPDYLGTPEEVKKEDELRPAKINWRRYMLEVDGQLVGFGVFLNSQGAFHPHEFWVTHVVLPKFHGQGFGKALDAHVMQALEPFRPQKLYSFSREDLPRKTRFLVDRGYRETLRSFESRLDLTAFKPESYAGLESQLAKDGIYLKTYAELATDPNRQRKIYDLHIAVDQDVPVVGEYTPPTFDEFAARHWNSDTFLPDGYFLAVAGDDYIGLTELYTSQADASLHTGLTGVRADYRKRGVAFALKVKAATFAKAYGAPKLSTWNASNNQGMLGINERLGFEKEPATIDFVKDMPA